MISKLYIENIAVIERAEIDFHKGFNVLLAYNLFAVAFLIETLPVEALASMSPVTLLLSLMLPVLATALTLVNV